MNWLTNFRTPGLKGLLSGTKKDTPDNLWVKCPTSGELVYRSDLEESWYVTPAGAHLRISPRRRFRLFFDHERWEPIPLPPVSSDPLKFKDSKKYTERLKDARASTGSRFGKIQGAEHTRFLGNKRKHIFLIKGMIAQRDDIRTRIKNDLGMIA